MLSMGMVVALGFLFMVLMMLTSAGQAATSFVGHGFPMPPWILGVISGVVAFVIATLFFAFLFKLLPDVKIKWRPIWMGALITGVLFTGGKYLLGLYLGRQGTASSYGAAGSVAVLLLWVYYASVIMFFGAEFTHVYAKSTGTELGPVESAQPVTEEQRAQEGIPRQRGQRKEEPPLEGPAGAEPQTT
jgi:membrane protein